jgi:hypothetical protein
MRQPGAAARRTGRFSRIPIPTNETVVEFLFRPSRVSPYPGNLTFGERPARRLFAD